LGFATRSASDARVAGAAPGAGLGVADGVAPGAGATAAGRDAAAFDAPAAGAASFDGFGASPSQPASTMSSMPIQPGVRSTVHLASLHYRHDPTTTGTDALAA
jgi:hypothetical protein